MWRRGARSSSSLIRKTVFSAIVTLFVLALAELCASQAQRRDIIGTHRPSDYVLFVEERIFVEEGDTYRTSAYTEETMMPRRFAREKGDEYRIFVLGGSFAQGWPESEAPTFDTRAGISRRLAERFEADRPDVGATVINAAAVGQVSFRVAQITDEILHYQPDLVVVATGNNESPLNPRPVEPPLHRSAAYRLFRTYIIDELGLRDDRGFDTDEEQLRTDFRTNLSLVLSATAARSVPVLLCTMPANHAVNPLDPIGKAHGPGIHIFLDPESEPLRTTCPDGLSAFEAGDYDDALSSLLLCRAAAPGRPPDQLDDLIVSASLHSDTWTEPLDAYLKAASSGHVRAGIEMYFQGQLAQSLHSLQAFVDSPDAVFYRGWASWRLGRAQEARRVLDRYLERWPGGRTRPSHNEIVVEEASRWDHTYLVDLAAVSAACSRDGLPGYDLFHDECHMRSAGYTAMGDAVWRVLVESGVLP